MCVVFTWEVEDEAKGIYFYTEDEQWLDKGVAAKDSRQVCQKESKTYYLRVVKLDDTVEVREIRIPVEAMPGL